MAVSEDREPVAGGDVLHSVAVQHGLEVEAAHEAAA